MPEKNIAIPSILKVSKGTLKDVGEYLAGDRLTVEEYKKLVNMLNEKTQTF